ncbi:glycosyltransferase family 2 protein [Parvularcula lutaonensis]|uniref:Glycosyltransferase family 2 protein n=1 Tax=Parvularcula lutaonensis TaxID=491923 RepID=A0ABV7MDV8_9PROT|nr:glycosyltransferase [Parvularcula lutaonensis]GGY38014.1 hypothetical protein GCM10007148_02850 [Parvularcula lutaonensis]
MTPDFSIVIPTYNRPGEIRGCIDALTSLRGPSFEVIVVDDGSDEPVASVLDRSQADIDVRVIRQANKGPGAARNRGAREARGRFLAFTDDDCRPVEGWLEAFADSLAEHPDRLAGGLVVNALTGNPFAAASQDIIAYGFLEDTTELTFFTSNNFACHREAFLALGGFDEALRISSEDRDFCIRWRAAGKQTVRADDALVHHRHELDLRGFWEQHTNYGRGARQMSDKLKVTGDAPPLHVRGPDYYADLISFPFRAGGKHRFARSMLIVLSHIAMARGFYWSAG